MMRVIVDNAVTGDALAFVSAPFDTAVSVEGLITGQLDVTINKRDFDFVLAAYELMPDGKLFWLTYYLGRASYADDMSAFAQVNYGTGKDVSDESVADARQPLEVQWYSDSFVKVPIRR